MPTVTRDGRKAQYDVDAVVPHPIRKAFLLLASRLNRITPDQPDGVQVAGDVYNFCFTLSRLWCGCISPITKSKLTTVKQTLIPTYISVKITLKTPLQSTSLDRKRFFAKKGWCVVNKWP
jgi:hypothetical protein